MRVNKHLISYLSLLSVDSGAVLLSIIKGFCFNWINPGKIVLEVFKISSLILDCQEMIFSPFTVPNDREMVF